MLSIQLDRQWKLYACSGGGHFQTMQGLHPLGHPWAGLLPSWCATTKTALEGERVYWAWVRNLPNVHHLFLGLESAVPRKSWFGNFHRAGVAVLFFSAKILGSQTVLLNWITRVEQLFIGKVSLPFRCPLCSLASTQACYPRRASSVPTWNLLYKQGFDSRPRQKGFPEVLGRFTNGIPCYSRAYLHLTTGIRDDEHHTLAGSETVAEPLTIWYCPCSAMFSVPVVWYLRNLSPPDPSLSCTRAMRYGEQDDHGVSTVEGHHIDIYVVVRFQIRIIRRQIWPHNPDGHCSTTSWKT